MPVICEHDECLKPTLFLIEEQLTINNALVSGA